MAARSVKLQRLDTVECLIACLMKCGRDVY
jgi:hypothetical protein